MMALKTINKTMLAVVLGGLLGLTACSAEQQPAPTLLSASEAALKYEHLAADVSDVLNTAYPGLELAPRDSGAPSVQAGNAGSCTFSTGTNVSRADVRKLAGGWEPVMKSLETALTDAGFPPITDEDSLKGGWTGISSTNDDGAELRVFAKGTTEMTLSVEVSDENCTPDALK